MKIELTIKTSYLPNWGAYEGIRELIQNGQDAKVEFGASFDVRYRKDTGVLVVENEGCTLPHEALLFGHTTKVDRSDLIGKFGEGLKLGVLALVRAGHAVKIRSGSEVWTPKIERSEKFDADVLVFYIEKGREPKNRVQVEIGNVSEDSWDRMDDHFLFLGKVPAKAQIKTSAGTLLLGEKYKGRVYVKGIFVQNSPELHFGYDLYDAQVDRDRKMVDSYDLNSKTQNVWRSAMASQPDLIGNFIELLETEAADVAGVNEWTSTYLSEDVKDKVAEHFVKRHGEKAIPVPSIADSAEVEHLGKKGVVCPKPLRLVLEQKLGTVADNKQKLAKETIKLYGWSELEDHEKANLERALFLVNGVTPVTLADVDIADFRDEKLLGLWKGADGGRILLARKILGKRDETLEVLVHEQAHKLGGGDGEKSHVANIERLWSGIVARLTDRVVS
jgi:hypothetical protein